MRQLLKSDLFLGITKNKYFLPEGKCSKNWQRDVMSQSPISCGADLGHVCATCPADSVYTRLQSLCCSPNSSQGCVESLQLHKRRAGTWKRQHECRSLPILPQNVRFLPMLRDPNCSMNFCMKVTKGNERRASICSTISCEIYWLHPIYYSFDMCPWMAWCLFAQSRPASLFFLPYGLAKKRICSKHCFHLRNNNKKLPSRSYTTAMLPSQVLFWPYIYFLCH